MLLKHFVELLESFLYISKDFPDEYANSESRIQLKGAVAKAKANAAQAIPEMIRIATNPSYKINVKKKHENDGRVRQLIAGRFYPIEKMTFLPRFCLAHYSPPF